MQKLHLVGITPDLDGLILSARKGAKSGSFVVTVDPAVLKQLLDGGRSTDQVKRNGRGDGTPASRPASLLSPREMQDLLRGGWTLEEVAAEAEVDVDWVARFEAPVRAEVRRILDHARELVFDKPRVGPSALRLGPSVRRNVAERGLRFTDEDFESCWRAYQLDEITWVVEFEYTSRGRHQLAEWTLDLELDALVSRNRLATMLGHVQSTRRKVSTAPAPKPKPKPAVVRANTAASAAPPPKSPAPPAPAAVKRPRTRQTGSRAATSKASAGGKTSKPPGPAESPAPAAPAPARPDPWRDELRRREAEGADSARAARAAPAPVRVPDADGGADERAPADVLRPVAVVGPTVRMLARRAPERAPAGEPPESRRLLPDPVDDRPADDDGWPDLEWSIADDRHGPLPPPGPVRVPDAVKERATAAPLGGVESHAADDDAADEDAADAAGESDDGGDDDEGAGDGDEAPVPPALRARRPVFRGAETAKRASRPRRREPLRGR